MPRILIIEDEPDMAAGLKDNFEYEGHEVIVANDGESGLAMALSHVPDQLYWISCFPENPVSMYAGNCG